MKIVILTVGRIKDAHVSSLTNRYISRLRTYTPVALENVPDVKDQEPSKRIAREGAMILKAINDRDFLVTLEERGVQFDSISFSAWLRSSLEAAQGRVVMVIGGAFGLSDEVRRRSDFSLSLSEMTLPHELCPLFLAEQLYRAASIANGVKYHH